MNVFSRMLNATFGFYGRKFNKDWSERLDFIMSNFDSVDINNYNLKFRIDNNVVCVWIANKFYSYGHLREINGRVVPKRCEFRPSYKVMRRLRKLELDVIARNEIREQKATNHELENLTPKPTANP